MSDNAPSKPLQLHEEFLLLILDNRHGTPLVTFPDLSLAGALIAELALLQRITVKKVGNQGYVDVLDNAPTGEGVLDSALKIIDLEKPPRPLSKLFHSLTSAGVLRNRVIRKLCDQGILQLKEDTVFFLFQRKTYPELDKGPEQEIRNRLRDAILSDDAPTDPRTALLISLAKGTKHASGVDLLSRTFGELTVRRRSDRITHIINGETIGQATHDAIAATEALMIMIMCFSFMSVMIANPS